MALRGNVVDIHLDQPQAETMRVLIRPRICIYCPDTFLDLLPKEVKELLLYITRCIGDYQWFHLFLLPAMAGIWWKIYHVLFDWRRRGFVFKILLEFVFLHFNDPPFVFVFNFSNVNRFKLHLFFL